MTIRYKTGDWLCVWLPTRVVLDSEMALLRVIARLS